MKIQSYLLAGFSLGFLYASPVSASATIESGLIKANAYETTHYQIEFSDLIKGQTDADENGLPDVVDTLAEAAEYSRGVIVDDLGYPDPLAGTGRKVLIILDDNSDYLSTGAMGVTTLLSNGDPVVAIDPWMSTSDLQITIGHELFHTIQFGYDDGFAYVGQGVNWAESTAVWMEDQEYNDNNDYVNYLSQFFDYPDYSVFASVFPSGTLFQYGLTIWPRFLSEYYNKDIIKTIWENYFGSSTDYSDDRKLYIAVKSAVNSNGGDLRTTFRDFTLWNLDLSQYTEGSTYPGVLVLQGTASDSFQAINPSYVPALFGANYLYFDNTGKRTDFYFDVQKPAGISFAVTLVPYVNGSVDLSQKQSVILDTSETMDSALDLSGLKDDEGVYAVISPLDSDFSGDHTTDFDEGYNYNFFAQFGSSGATFSALSGSTSSSTSSQTTDQKQGQTADFASGDVKQTNTLNLKVASYNEDSASFTWNRLSDSSDTSGYIIRYGVSSGKYIHEQAVSHAYTTAATVSGLTEGTTYYFEVVATNSAGKTIGDPSPELSVKPTAWIFSDVSYLNSYYDAIASLTDAGVFSGYEDGSFKPDATINRAELLKILVEGRDLSPDPTTYQNCFSDVGSEWYAKYVCYAKAQGWVSGYSDGTFRPGNAVNKVEALKILFQVYQAGLSDGGVSSSLSYTDLDQNAWYATYVWKASQLGILSEALDGNFDPSESRTRGEMAEELYRYMVSTGLVKE